METAAVTHILYDYHTRAVWRIAAVYLLSALISGLLWVSGDLKKLVRCPPGLLCQHLTDMKIFIPDCSVTVPATGDAVWVGV